MCLRGSISVKKRSFRGVGGLDGGRILFRTQARITLLHHGQLRCHRRAQQLGRAAGYSLVVCFWSCVFIKAPVSRNSPLSWWGYARMNCGRIITTVYSRLKHFCEALCGWATEKWGIARTSYQAASQDSFCKSAIVFLPRFLRCAQPL